MTTERWDDVVALFERALDHSPEEREAFVERAAGADVVLRDRVLAMLRADSGSSPLDAGPEAVVDAVAAVESSLEGRPVGPYRLIREIGRGGMGVVWLAEREDIGKRVALKLVTGWIGSPDRVARFLLERRVLAQLEHTGIARLLDAGVADDGTPWLAMEYVDGRPIDEHCAAKGLDIPARLELFADVCDAVAYAHRNLVVHRDLKPSNILVAEAGDPRLVDFGIAKLLADSGISGDTLTWAGSYPLTPDYASPEQVRGGTITTASDVYQLGVLLYELLAGDRPRRLAGRPIHEMAAAVEESVAPPSSIASPPARGRIAGDLDNIVLKAMRTEPERRYRSAEQLGDDVRRHLTGLPVLARPGGVRYRTAKFIRRHKAGTAMAAAMAVVLLASGIGLALQAGRVARQRDQAEQVSRILIDMFSSANPDVALGDTVTVRAVLDRGAERVAAELTGDPGVRARIFDVIAAAYRNLGAFDRAMAIQDQAVETLRASSSPGDEQLIEALRVQGMWRAEAGQPDVALSVLAEALAMVRQQRGRDPVELARVLSAYAFAHQLAGDLETAQPMYAEAVAILRAEPDSLAPDLERVLVNLGWVAMNVGDVAGADTLLREALDRRSSRLGRANPATAATMSSLADILVARGEFDEAEQLAKEGVATLRGIYDQPHHRLADALSTLASVSEATGDLEGAESIRREALAQFRSVYGDDHLSVAREIADLATLISNRGRRDEAASLYADAIAQYERLLGPNNVSTAITISNLAYTEYLSGRLAEAERLYRRAIPLLDSAWAGSNQVAPTLVDFATVLIAGGSSAEAEPLLRRALSSERDRWPADHVRVLRPLRTLGACLVNLRRFDEAEPILLEAHQTLAESWGETNSFTLAAARDLVSMYELWGRPADAAKYRAGSDTALEPRV